MDEKRNVVPRLGGYLLVLLGVGALVLSFGVYTAFLSGMLGRISSDSMSIHADFDTFWRSANAYLDGEDLYDAGARLVNLNPPLWTVIISPLGFLEPIVAYRVFTQVTVLLVVGYLVWMSREVRNGGAWASLSMGMLLVSSPLLGTLALGQIYAFLTLGLVCAWSLDRRGWRVGAGVALGLTIAIKPSLLPLVLWPTMRRRWDTLGATLFAGAGITLVAALSAGFQTTFDWLRLLFDSPLNTYWDNASLPAAAARIFTENEYAMALADAPWTVVAAYLAGLAAIGLSAWFLRRDPSLGFWSLVAASLMVSPIAWHNYLMLLAPGVIILISYRKYALAFFLLALQIIPPQWPLLWQQDYALDTVMLSLYAFVLVIHWLALLPFRKTPYEDLA